LLETLGSWDRSLFLFCHQTLKNSGFDFFFPLITNQRNWYLPLSLGAILFVILAGDKKKRLLLILCLIAAVGISDLAEHHIKNWVARPRPFQAMPEVHPLVDAYGHSFPSGHATNSFAACVFLAIFFKRWKWWLLALASLVAFSRVYVGVHYPGDVLGGAVLGSAVARAMAGLYALWLRKKDRLSEA